MTERCPGGMKVQSIIVPFELTTRKREAERLVRRRQGKIRWCDKTSQSFRFRQLAPSKFVVGSFRTIDLGKGVRAVVGCPLDNPGPRPESWRLRRSLKHLRAATRMIPKLHDRLREADKFINLDNAASVVKECAQARSHLTMLHTHIDRAVRAVGELQPRKHKHRARRLPAWAKPETLG